MIHYKRHIIIVSLIFCSFIKDDHRGDIQSALLNYYNKYPSEKIYLQTDGSFYTTGETIWYKVFCIAYDMPSGISKIAYVQLVNNKGHVVLLNKLPLQFSNGNGDIQLPDSLETGNYVLRAFTAWMLNFEEPVFEKTIFIKNINDPDEEAKCMKQSPEYNIHFFPEGGDMVDSNLCHIAFKTTDQFGMPAAIYGEIKDNNQKVVALLKTFHDGMGEFDIRPFPNLHYSAYIHFPDSSMKRFELPGCTKDGISIHVSNQATSFDLVINYKGNEFVNYKNLILAAYQNNGKVATFPLELHPGKNIFTIPKTGFGTGILRLTLFDSSGKKPLAERLIFNSNKDGLRGMLQKDSVSAKKKSFYTLKLLTADGVQVKKGSYAVAVTDADKDAQDDLQGNIYSNFFLNSELKGYIHNPAYYFNNTNDSTLKALDLIMQTNGWRRFKWHQVMNNEDVALHYKAEQDLYAAGEITNYSKIKDKDLFVLNIIVETPDSSRYAGYVRPDSSGKFVLENYNFSGKSSVYFNWVSADKNLDTTGIGVKFYSSSIDSIINIAALDLQLHNKEFLASDEWKNWIKKEKNDRLRIIEQVQHVKQTVLNNKPVDTIPTSDLIKKYTSTYFKTKDTYTLDMINDSFPAIPGFYDLLKKHLPPLTVGGNEKKPRFFLRAANAETSLSGTQDETQAEPNFYINEVLVSYEALRKIPLESIALVRYIPSPFAMAPNNGGSLGTIAVYLKKGKDIRYKSFSIKGKTAYTYNGYSVTREFYEPGYDSTSNNIKNTARTLYWNPDIITDTNGNLHFSFSNFTKAKNLRITIEGIDENGKLLHYSAVVK